MYLIIHQNEKSLYNGHVQIVSIIMVRNKCVQILNEPVHEISINQVCATSKASDQPAHMRSLIRAFASRLSIL